MTIEVPISTAADRKHLPLVAFKAPRPKLYPTLNANTLGELSRASSIRLCNNRSRGSSMKKVLVTGSSGLIGSEVCLYFAAEGWQVHGIDNNQRAIFFGPKGDTRWNQHRLEEWDQGLRSS